MPTLPKIQERFGHIFISTLFGLLALISSNTSTCGQTVSEINQMLRNYSDDIATEKALAARGLGSPGGAAIPYSHRGKVFLLYSQQPTKAVADFSEAIRLLESDTLDDRSRSTLADCYVFRSRAHNELKKRPLALSDSAEAIRLFEEMVKGGAEHAEPTLVYALKSRVEALIGTGPTDQTIEEDLKQALAAIDQAIPLLEKWAKKGSNDDFFQSELTQLREKRATVAAAIDKPAGSAPDMTLDRAPRSVTVPGSEVAAEDQRFIIIGNDLPGTTSIFATSVSGDGRMVVGFVRTSEGTQAFRWNRLDGLTLLQGLDGDKGKSRAAAASANGKVIAGYSSSEDGKLHAVIWNEGNPPEKLPAHNGMTPVECVAVSADGHIVAGHLEDAFGNNRSAFTWSKKDGMQPVDSTMVLSGKKFTAISNVLTLSQNGRILGGSMEHGDIDFNSACVWVDGQGAPISPKEFKDGVSRVMPLFIATRSSVTALTVDAEGAVAGLVGRYQNKNRGGVRGYHIANGKFSWLENADGVSLSFPNAVSENGSVVVGQGRTAGRIDVACFWSARTGVVQMEEHLSSDNVSTNGLKLSSASGVSSDSRTIVGVGTDDRGRSLAWIATTSIHQ